MTLGKRIKNSTILFVIITGLCITSFFFPSLETTINSHELGNILTAPSWSHILGTDAFGRDILFRSLFGLRNSLGIALVVTIVTALIGLALGVACVQYTNAVMSHAVVLFCDSMISFPGILFALLIAIFLPPGVISIIVILFIVGLPYFVRLGLLETMQLQSQEFVASAYCMGCRKIDVLVSHYIPNLIFSSMPLMIQAILGGIHIESVLSYFGIGLQSPYTSLGLMIYEARRYGFVQPTMLYFPLFLLIGVSFMLVSIQKRTQRRTVSLH